MNTCSLLLSSKLLKARDKEVFEDNLEVFILLLSENRFCNLSLESPQQDGSDDGHSVCFYGDILKIIHFTPYLRYWVRLFKTNDVVS